MSDRILFSIGEALIDMIPSRVGCSFDEVPAFSPRVGGAPANVCAAVARLGGRSALLSQLGDDCNCRRRSPRQWESLSSC